MAIRNAPEGEILSLVNGGFSERFAKVAESCERRVERVVAPWGAMCDLNEVESALASRRFAAVTVAHSETSTGVITDVRAVAELAHRHGAIALVDSVSGVGGAELTVDGWGLDFVLTGSQKALALPAGLAFAVASAEYVERAKSVRNRGFYFDVVQYDAFAAKNQTPSTPATSLLYALEAQMGDIGREGIERRWDRHLAMRDATVEWVQAAAERRNIDLGVLAPAELRSPTVTVVTLPQRHLHQGSARSDFSARLYRGRRLRKAQRHDDSHRPHGRPHASKDSSAACRSCEQAIAELAERRRLVRA